MRLASVFLGLFRFAMPVTRRRRIDAAMGVLLAKAVYETLDGTQRSKIDTELIKVYEPYGIYPWWRLRPDAVASDPMACDRTIAMWRLNVPTGIKDLAWEDVLHPWHKQDPLQLHQDFQPFHADTDEAIQRLAAKGVALPSSLHYGKKWLERARTGPSQT